MGTTRERNPSLWVDVVSPDHPALEADVSVDVAIVGAGITGLTLARLLTSEGATVAIVEAGEIAAGATGYTTAKVTCLHSLTYASIERSFGPTAARTYADANRAGMAKVTELAAGLDCDLQSAAAYTYTQSEDRIVDVEAEVDAAQRAGLDAQSTTVTELPFDVRAAVRLEAQYQFHPRTYCVGLARSSVADGAAVFEHSRAVAIDERRSIVTTEQGAVHAPIIVLASHVPFCNTGAFFARLEPQRSYAIAARVNGSLPTGMYIGIDNPVRSIRATADGWLIVGGEGHTVGHDDDTTVRYTSLERWTRQWFDVASIDYRWSAQDYRSLDGLPYVGRLASGSQHVFVATGYGKWGMTNGTAAAMLLADLIQGRANDWATTFDSTRRAPQQSAVRFVSTNVEVAKHFVLDRLASARVPNADTLVPGMGGLVELDGDTVAAFRSENGTLSAVSATCTHLGCRVKLNTAERTWDCPCHGSRFDLEGRVLEGPAVRDLANKLPESRSSSTA